MLRQITGRLILRRWDDCIRLIRKDTNFAIPIIECDCDVAVMNTVFDMGICGMDLWDRFPGDPLTIYARRVRCR